jgi:peptide/nickel transport system ATP-binding protein
MSAALLEVRELVKHYRLPRQALLAPAPVVEALRGVSFSMTAGRNLGIVGESGSGKSTLARLVMALEAPTSGTVRFEGRGLNALPAAELRAVRRDFQMVFQDPYGSLDPRQKVARIVAEPLPGPDRADRAGQAQRVAEALEAVGLRAADAHKYPHEFSGGQRQRIAIARALITRPKLIVADEPVSALDVSVQAQVLNLMLDLQQRFGVSYLFISHDLAVVDHVCEEIVVMQHGRIVDAGPAQRLFQGAEHPYTRSLLAAARFQ